MSNASLRLTPDTNVEPDSFLFERRQSIRRRMRGKVTALILSREGQNPAVTSRKICAMSLSDMSETGLGALSQEPANLGDEITIFFPPHGPEKGFDLKGTIVRQSAGEEGETRLGIRYGRQIMAA